MFASEGFGSPVQFSGQAKAHLSVEGVVDSWGCLLVNASEERVASSIIGASGGDEHAMGVVVVVVMMVMGGAGGRMLFS